MLSEALGLVEDLSALREVSPSSVIRQCGARLTVCLLRFASQELMKGDKEVRWQPQKRRCVQDRNEQGRRCVPPEIDSVDQDWGALIREASEDAAGLERA
jgi:hypothetical protein